MLFDLSPLMEEMEVQGMKWVQQRCAEEHGRRSDFRYELVHFCIHVI